MTYDLQETAVSKDDDLEWRKWVLELCPLEREGHEAWSQQRRL